MNFLQVTVVRILVKVSPGKKRNTTQVWILLTYNCFLGGPVVLMTVHSMIKLLKETILNAKKETPQNTTDDKNTDSLKGENINPEKSKEAQLDTKLN